MAWELSGYTGSDSVKGLIGSLAGRTALVCGGAETVFEDYKNANFHILLSSNCDLPVTTFAVNDVGMYLPVVNHWVSLHGDKLKAWSAARKLDGSLSQGWVEHTNWAVYGCERTWALEPALPLSGLFAAQIAFLMGCERIILCGCPGDKTRRFFDAQPRQDYGYGGGDSSKDQNDRLSFIFEMNRVPELREAIRSMSGWTKDYFGGIE